MIQLPTQAELRQQYIDVWDKHLLGVLLDQQEQALVNVISDHLEYHGLLTGNAHERAAALEKEYSVELGESNPFLHMSLHLAIREQISVDRPSGVVGIHQELCSRKRTSHEAEHDMMDCLVETIWKAQRYQREMDETEYLEMLRKL